MAKCCFCYNDIKITYRISATKPTSISYNITLLSDRLHYIINHKELLPKMGEASFRLFEKQFTIRAMVEKYSKVYKDE